MEIFLVTGVFLGTYLLRKRRDNNEIYNLTWNLVFLRFCCLLNHSVTLTDDVSYIAVKISGSGKYQRCHGFIFSQYFFVKNFFICMQFVYELNKQLYSCEFAFILDLSADKALVFRAVISRQFTYLQILTINKQVCASFKNLVRLKLYGKLNLGLSRERKALPQFDDAICVKEISLAFSYNLYFRFI